MTLLKRFASWIGLSLVVQGQSMEPTYPSGNPMRVRPLTYFFHSPARGDVVALRSPAMPERLELKRIIGLPNETVSWCGGHVSIDGVPLQESYARIPPAPPGDDEWRTVRLDRNAYFVAGDNRLYSEDSRNYGPVSRGAILGPVHLSEMKI